MEPVRPLPVAPPRFPGVHAGVVKDVSDPDELGRIQVAVPAVFDGDGPDAAAWARPCFPWGHFFVPEVGDHVWVAFEGGDPTAPVWLGAWYASGATPADAAVSPPVKRLVVSASGHEILLDDTSGSERVLVRDKAGSTIELKADGVHVTSAADLTIEASGSMTLQAATMVLKASSVDVQT